MIIIMIRIWWHILNFYPLPARRPTPLRWGGGCHSRHYEFLALRIEKDVCLRRDEKRGCMI